MLLTNVKDVRASAHYQPTHLSLPQLLRDDDDDDAASLSLPLLTYKIHTIIHEPMTRVVTHISHYHIFLN